MGGIFPFRGQRLPSSRGLTQSAPFNLEDSTHPPRASVGDLAAGPEQLQYVVDLAEVAKPFALEDRAAGALRSSLEERHELPHPHAEQLTQQEADRALLGRERFAAQPSELAGAAPEPVSRPQVWFGRVAGVLAAPLRLPMPISGLRRPSWAERTTGPARWSTHLSTAVLRRSISFTVAALYAAAAVEATTSATPRKRCPSARCARR
jgi:hypothetical protein